MRDSIRDQLLETLSKLRGVVVASPDDPSIELEELMFLRYDAEPIAKFIKVLAAEQSDFELIGIADTIIHLTRHLDDEDERIEQEHHDNLLISYWEDKKWYRPSDIGKRLNIDHGGATTNKILAEMGYQEKGSGVWRATKAGMKWSRAIDSASGEESYLRWSPEVVVHVAEHLNIGVPTIVSERPRLSDY